MKMMIIDDNVDEIIIMTKQSVTGVDDNDDADETVMARKHFRYYWHFVRRIPRSPMDHPHQRPVIQNFDDFLCCLSE